MAQITTGILQESILGPVLLQHYIYDLVNISTLFNLFFFVDNTTIISKIDVNI